MNLFAISGSSGNLQPRPQAANQMVQRAQAVHIQDRNDRFDRVHAQHVRGIGPDRSRAAIGQLHDEEHHPVDTSEVTSSEQLPEQRMSRRCYPHLARQRRPNVLQSVAITSGTGKTHLVEALAHAAIDTGRRVAWFTLESLTTAVGRAAADGSTTRAITKITRADLIVVDDIGMLPAGQAAAEALYRVIDAAYERRSVAVTSNLHPSGFDTIMPKTLATATVDRLLHHAHIVLTEGTSHRLAEATAGKGVVPLT